MSKTTVGQSRLQDVEQRIDQGVSRMMEAQSTSPRQAVAGPLSETQTAVDRAEKLMATEQEREMELMYMHEMHAETTQIKPAEDMDVDEGGNQVLQILVVLGAREARGHRREHRTAMNKVISRI